MEGKGCKEMLYPGPKSEQEQELNRRVEIKVLEF
jgi:flagellar motor protein MotB